MPSVLVVEDEPDLRRLLGVILQRAGHTVIDVADGRAALRAVHDRRPDLVLLDVGLPDLDGWQVLERIRDISVVPVILLTAHGAESDKVRGLNSGADDYVTKPFSRAELLARISAVLRRPSDPVGRATPFSDGRLTVDLAGRSATVDGRPLALTPLEYRLLAAFVRHANQVLAPDQLLQLAWDDPMGVGPDRVKFAVMRLRRKLSENDSAYAPIEARRGFGYRFVSSARLPHGDSFDRRDR
jgi:DNA-binding response OmpR family regulator